MQIRFLLALMSSGSHGVVSEPLDVSGLFGSFHELRGNGLGSRPFSVSAESSPPSMADVMLVC